MTSPNYWACPGCGSTYSTGDPDLITGHVRDCDYVDGAGQPAELTVKFSATCWYIARIPAGPLAAASGAMPFADLRGPADEDDTELTEFLSDLADEIGAAMTDGFTITDVYPAWLDSKSTPGPSAPPPQR
jgi:hypothetical protein